MHKRYDVVVVGSGIAGLSFALKVADKGRSVAIVTKKKRADSNTNYAQGGIACVIAKDDDFTAHVEDTLVAGAGLCNRSVVDQVVREGPERIQELVEWGVEFSKSNHGYSLGKEGGHSSRRILHVQDMTGRAIEQALLTAVASAPSIDLFEHHFAVDIITASKFSGAPLPPEEDKVHGLYVLNTQSGLVETWAAPVILLATGGIGQIYQYTTNPDIATGDGIAIAHRAGAPIRDMEFVQFHPTALFVPDNKDRFLISEAVRGEGAILRDGAGLPFMQAYDSRGELAPRDVVARAIDAEMKQSGMQHMWLDLTAHDKAHLESRFPQIYKRCAAHGIAIERDWVPIVPAAHYVCGGVNTALSGATPIAGLYACGEVACTGLHGANRLASNSLLEAVVVAHRGARAVGDYLSTLSQEAVELPSWIDGDLQDSDERVVLAHNWDELKRLMWDYVGIVRTEKRLLRARTRVDTLAKEIDEYYWNFKIEPKLLELRNMIAVAQLIIEAALKRKDSCGLHFRLN
tara:strand:- start:4823 stop:6373 length:1551 start_codon:yes stop_codon:yes gene_type:complete